MANDLEWLSECCGAHAKFPLHHEESIITIGICDKCGDHAGFELWGDEDEYDAI